MNNGGGGEERMRMGDTACICTADVMSSPLVCCVVIQV